ncbi:MAG: FkbM family methyltransferase [Alphaproteobacteria bacterium]|jgi:FkbM family methyltransferase
MIRFVPQFAAIGVLAAMLAGPVAGPALGQSAYEGLVNEAVLRGAGGQLPSDRATVQQFLFGDDPAPQVIAAPAAVAIRALAASGLYDDPVALLDAADNIASTAVSMLNPPRVMRTFVPNNYVLPSGSHGFDFGPADSSVMPGFEAVRPDDTRVTGNGRRALHRPGDNNLLADGIVGLQTFVTPMPNGIYRVLLITDDIGDEQTLQSPLGGRIIVNGKVIELGDHPSSNWLPEAAARFEALFAGNESVRLVRAALGPARGEAELHVSARNDSSSLLPIGDAQARMFPGTGEVGMVTVPVGPLGDFVERAELGAPALLKIDVQGFELEVLRGAEALLDAFDWIYVEASWVALYEGQALAGEVEAFVTAHGFALAGTYNRTDAPDGSPVQADFLFRRESAC